MIRIDIMTIGKDYIVATISELYIAATGIIKSSLKYGRQFLHA